MAKSEEKREMKVVKKFAIVQVNTEFNERNSEYVVNLNIPIDRLSYARCLDMIFDTEHEAIEHAFKINSYVNWVILPIITFDNF